MGQNYYLHCCGGVDFGVNLVLHHRRCIPLKCRTFWLVFPSPVKLQSDLHTFSGMKEPPPVCLKHHSTWNEIKNLHVQWTREHTLSMLQNPAIRAFPKLWSQIKLVPRWESAMCVVGNSFIEWTFQVHVHQQCTGHCWFEHITKLHTLKSSSPN